MTHLLKANPVLSISTLKVVHSPLFLAISCLITSAVLAPKSLASDAEIEQIVVVGSHLSGRADRASPVQSLTAEEVRAAGSMSLGDTLQALPSVGFSMNSTGYYGPGNGTSSLNLRGLGENRNLILVNGHRWVNASNKGGLDFVDLHTIPQSIVRSVDVLPEGASAIYGSDAIAGVVNINTFKDYEGMQVDVSYGESSEHDRESEKIDILAGKNFGSSNVMVTISHADQRPAYMQDRSISRVPLNGYATKTNEGIFKENNLQGVLGESAVTRDPESDGSVVGNWRAVDGGTDVSNPFHNNYLESPSRRTSVFVQSNTEFESDIMLTLSGLYNRRDSKSLLSSASPSSLVRGSRGFSIPVNPLVNPFPVEFSGNDFRLENFFGDVGQRVKAQDIETVRLASTLTGNLGTNWTWEIFGSWSENKALTTNTNEIDLDKLALGMRACDGTGISADISDLQAGCVPVNLFNPLSADMIDYIAYTAYEHNKVNQSNFSANLTGAIYELPAGSVNMAVGYEYRSEEAYDDRDVYAGADPRVNTYRTLSLSARDLTDGEYDIGEFYVEMDIPLITDRPLIEDLSINIASRYSDYSTFGSTTNSRAALNYALNSELTFRGSWSEGFRAPSIMELYAGSRISIRALTDPCGDHAANFVGCANVPDTYVPSAYIPMLRGGNINLEPETSVNRSVGFTYAPEKLARSSISADWHRIELKNTISDYGEQNILDSCALRGQLCSLIQREASGEIIQFLNVPVNLSSTSLEVLDVAFQTNAMVAGGDLSFKMSASKLLEMEKRTPLPSGVIVETNLVGTATVAESYPEWRASANLMYSKDKWNVSAAARYIDETEESVSGVDYSISSVVYVDASAAYEFTSELRVKFGLNNVFDKQPPASYSNRNLNFDPTTYNATGRYYYTQLTYNF